MKTWLDKYDINLYSIHSEIEEKKLEYGKLDVDLIIGECMDYKKAIEYFKKAYKLQLYDDAISFLNEVPQENKNHLLYFYLAKVHCSKEQYSLAIKYYKKAIKLNPNEFGYSRELFSIYKQRDKFLEALQLFQKMIMDESDKTLIEEFCYDALSLAQRFYQNNTDLFSWIISCKEQLKQSSLANIIKICDQIYDENILDNEHKDCQQDMYIALIELYSQIHDFLQDSRCKRIQKDDVFVHYTTIDTLKKIVDTSNGNNLNYHLYNATYMNDPAEGKTLINHLAKSIIPEQNQVKDNLLKQVIEYYEGIGNEKLEPCKTYLGCFSMSKDQLPMWGMYGAKGNGVCCVVSNSFFDIIPLDVAPSISDCHLFIPRVDSQGTDDANDSNETLHPNYLYKVSYLTKTSYSSDNFYVDIWARSLRKIAQCFGMMNQVQRKNLIKAVAWILDEVRFLFKDADYAYEQEYRLIRCHDLNDNYVNLDLDSIPYPKVFVNAGNPEKFKYEEIILGSKIQSPEMIAPWLLKTKIVESVSLSKIQYR